MCTVLEILKQECRGITLEQFLKRAREEGIQNPLQELKDLKEKGFARIDEHPRPVRFKATNAAFN